MDDKKRKIAEEIKTVDKKAFQFFIQNDFNKLAEGHYELDDGAYVNISSYLTKSRDNCKFEAHRKYIDIQYIIDGSEIMELTSSEKLKVSEPYSADKDIEIYEDVGNMVTVEKHTLNKGDVIIVKTGTAHMGCIEVVQSVKVRKAVFKIPVTD